MKVSQNIRLLLVDDPLPGLFMSSWFLQNNLNQDKNTTTIGIYVCLNVDDSFSADSAQKKPIHLQASRDSVQDIVDYWLEFPSPRYFTGVLDRKSLKAVLRERKYRGQELSEIKRFLQNNGINPLAVTEIWSRDALMDRHFFYVCPNARAIFMEHGLPDIRNSILERKETRSGATLARRMKQWFSDIFDRIVLYFSYSRLPQYQRVSIMADEILKANPNNSTIKKLLPDSLKVAAGFIAKSESLFLSKIEKDCALILTMFVYPKPWGLDSKNDQLKMLTAFEDYLIQKYESYFLDSGIRTLVFKSKFFHEEYTAEGVDSFQRLRKKFKVVYLPDFSPKNYPSEFYIPHFQPKLILSAYSSIVFFGKKICPQVEVFTYDDWFIDYSKRCGFKQFRDFGWYRKVFNEEFRSAFEALLPKSFD